MTRKPTTRPPGRRHLRVVPDPPVRRRMPVPRRQGDTLRRVADELIDAGMRLYARAAELDGEVLA